VITGLDSRTIVDAVELVTRQFEVGPPPPLAEGYRIDNVAPRVVRLILRTARLSNRWQGIAGSDASA
jgi:UDP-N-acetylglucosamine 2-epimerase (non-hydrolysing)